MKEKKKYSKEFKLDAISLVKDQGYSRLEARKSLGINRQLISRWINEHESAGEESFRGNGKLRADQLEIRRLKEENKRLKMEKEILKKAAANSIDHCNTSLNLSAGARKFNVFRGLSFNSLAILSKSN
jgi:transposase